LSLFDLSFRAHNTLPRGGRVMRSSAKCVFFISVGIHKSEEHNSESTHNYSGKTQVGAPEAPL